MYDIIGDIHGHADELVQLLERLGYRRSHGTFRHPERKVIFLGDFIDRGPKIRQVLEIVRPMIEEGMALTVMGNHELNALAYHTEDPESPGDYLRPHIQKNVNQHRQTVEQLNPQELQSYLDWFRKLPMWLDLDGLRVVHACWDIRGALLAFCKQANSPGQQCCLFGLQRCQKGIPLRLPMEWGAEIERREFRVGNFDCLKDCWRPPMPDFW